MVIDMFHVFSMVVPYLFSLIILFLIFQATIIDEWHLNFQLKHEKTESLKSAQNGKIKKMLQTWLE
jgi:hypothetical protein